MKNNVTRFLIAALVVVVFCGIAAVTWAGTVGGLLFTLLLVWIDITAIVFLLIVDARIDEEWIKSTLDRLMLGWDDQDTSVVLFCLLLVGMVIILR